MTSRKSSPSGESAQGPRKGAGAAAAAAAGAAALAGGAGASASRERLSEEDEDEEEDDDEELDELDDEELEELDDEGIGSARRRARSRRASTAAETGRRGAGIGASAITVERGARARARER